MRRSCRIRWSIGIGAAALVVAASAPLHAQTAPAATQPAGRLSTPPVSAEPWFRPGTWLLSVQVGGAAFTDFQRAEARLAGENAEIAFERRLSATTAVSIGASVGYWFGQSWGLRAAAAYVPSRFSVHTAETELSRLREAGDPGPEAVAEDEYAALDIWIADATLVFRFPHSFGRVIPYGLAGAGVVHYRAGGGGPLPPEAREPFRNGGRSSIAGVMGIGGVLPLQRNNLLLSFELTNHLARTPLDDAGAGETFDLRGMPVRIADETSAGGSDGIGMTSNLRLNVGLTLPVR